MLDHEFVHRKIKLLQEDLHELEKYVRFSYAEFARETMYQLAIERLLEQLVTRAIDINQHLIARLGKGTERVRTYEDGFLVLAELGVYSPDFARSIAPSAGLRNKLVHEYDEIDERLVYESMKDALRDYPKYCDHILSLLDRVEEKK